MDLLAAELGIDPVELRRRNALRPGDPFPTSGQPFDANIDVVGLLDRCLALPLPRVPTHALERARRTDPYAGSPGGRGARRPARGCAVASAWPSASRTTSTARA